MKWGNALGIICDKKKKYNPRLRQNVTAQVQNQRYFMGLNDGW